MSRSLEFQRQTPVWSTDHPLAHSAGGRTSDVDYSTGYDPSPLHPDFTPGASVVVRSPRTSYEYDGSVSRDMRNRSGLPDDYGDDHSTWRRGDGPHGQRSLFDIKHQHPYVSWLGTHPDFRGHVATLLGVAATQTKARYGEYPRSDTSLSRESRRVVERAAAAGAVRMPDFVSPNDYSSRNSSNYTVPTQGSMDYPANKELPATTSRTLPRPDVELGRQFARSVLRRPRQAIEKASEISGVKKAQQQEFFK